MSIVRPGSSNNKVALNRNLHLLGLSLKKTIPLNETVCWQLTKKKQPFLYQQNKISSWGSDKIGPKTVGAKQNSYEILVALNSFQNCKIAFCYATPTKFPPLRAICRREWSMPRVMRWICPSTLGPM